MDQIVDTPPRGERGVLSRPFLPVSSVTPGSWIYGMPTTGKTTLVDEIATSGGVALMDTDRVWGPWWKAYSKQYGLGGREFPVQRLEAERVVVMSLPYLLQQKATVITNFPKDEIDAVLEGNEDGSSMPPQLCGFIRRSPDDIAFWWAKRGEITFREALDELNTFYDVETWHAWDKVPPCGTSTDAAQPGALVVLNMLEHISDYCYSTERKWRKMTKELKDLVNPKIAKSRSVSARVKTAIRAYWVYEEFLEWLEKKEQDADPADRLGEMLDFLYFFSLDGFDVKDVWNDMPFRAPEKQVLRDIVAFLSQGNNIDFLFPAMEAWNSKNKAKGRDERSWEIVKDHLIVTLQEVKTMLNVPETGEKASKP